MEELQLLAQGYLASAGYKLISSREGFLVADRLGFGGDRDTRLLWVAPPSAVVRNFRELERGLTREFESHVPQYPQARYSLLAHSLEGFSREFRLNAARFRIRTSVPVDFFDAPLRDEEAPGQLTSAIAKLKDPEPLRKRVPQPYVVSTAGQAETRGDDLLRDLFKELAEAPRPCLRIVVGTAGAGKSVFFQALFSRIYRHFQDQKKRKELFPRPIPFVPAYLREALALRTEALIESFLRAEVAAAVPLFGFEWLLVNGFSSWMFDGLDELYTGDPDFFEYLLDILTRPASKAQLLVCARDSLLSTSEGFARFLEEFPPSLKGIVRVYHLSDWEHVSKRTFAWIRLEGRTPAENEADTTQVKKFLHAITQSESLKSLSGIPYYCGLLLDEFQSGTMAEISDDFGLIDHVVSGMIGREREKGLLSEDEFEPQGLTEWLETIATEFYETEFRGLSRGEVEEYAHLVLRPELSAEERRDAITTLIQFPLFAPGLKPGLVTFKHELVAEYLAGCYLVRHITRDPAWVARVLGERVDFADSLIARYMANRLAGEDGAIQAILNALRAEALPGRSFANLLQLLLLASPSRNLIKANRIDLESKDLRYLKFTNLDLSGLSFRNSDLSNVLFKSCNMQNAFLEGAHFSGTSFEDLPDGALQGARFGNLERLDFLYVGRQRIDTVKKAAEWLQQATGRIEVLKQPCPAALQLRTLFLKFVYPDGKGRRDELWENALSRGKRYPGAPNPEECITAAIRSGYLQGPDWRRRIKRTPGERYTDVVLFVRDSKLTADMRTLLDSLCSITGCQHVPAEAI